LSLKGLTSGSQPGGFEDIEFLPLGKLAGFLKDFIQDAGVTVFIIEGKQH